jgi:hypothetical protein
MANDDQDDGVYASAAASQPEHRSRRRKQAVVAVVGLAAVLGGGAFFITEMVTGVSNVAGAFRGTGELAPMTSVVSPSASSPPPPAHSSASKSPTSRRVAARVSRTPSPSASETLSTAERIEAARAAAAKDGFPLQRPLVPPKVATDAVAPTVTNIGSLQTDGLTMRVVSAKYDLTGQRELAWAADGGEPVGAARCTQNFRFSNTGTPQERPTMLLCWHTSAGKSVLTVAVTKSGRPSRSASVAAIDKAWSALS